MPASRDLKSIPLPHSAEPGPARPPARFDRTSFADYRPDGASQEAACREVEQFVRRQRERLERAGERRGAGMGRRLVARLLGATGGQGAGRSGGPGGTGSAGLYLDGGYGVGKTHLLASAFHAAGSVPRAYLTFQELVHQIGALGMAGACERLAGGRLLCLDEFELDDPGNTLMVKRFLEHVFASGGAVLTTSNTPPEAQGTGRFNAEDFRREIQGIAEHFRVVRVEGADYRRRMEGATLLDERQLAAELERDRSGGAVSADLDELLAVLREVHPVRYSALIGEFSALYLQGISTIEDQNDALRFVHFIDGLYNSCKRLVAAGDIELDELFDASYRNGAYSRKHERCISRLTQLLAESRRPAGGADGLGNEFEAAD